MTPIPDPRPASRCLVVNHIDPLGLKWYHGWWEAAKALVGAADPEVQQAFDNSNWDRSHGTGDAVVSRATLGAVGSIGGTTIDQSNRDNAKLVAGVIMDTTVSAIAGAGAGRLSQVAGAIDKAQD